MLSSTITILECLWNYLYTIIIKMWFSYMDIYILYTRINHSTRFSESFYSQVNMIHWKLYLYIFPSLQFVANGAPNIKNYNTKIQNYNSTFKTLNLPAVLESSKNWVTSLVIVGDVKDNSYTLHTVHEYCLTNMNTKLKREKR